MRTERPNVLVLLSDQHHYRYLGHRDDGEPVETPTIDALAARATSFERAYCGMPLCTPARLCLLTGSHVRRAGAWTNRSVLTPGLPTLPGVLSDAGYRTCLVGKMHLGGNRQYAGFDRRPYGDLTGHAGHQFEPPDAARVGIDWRSLIADAGVTGIPESLLQERVVASETLAFLREHRAREPGMPWFVCASFNRPHWPRTAPPRHVDRYWPDGVTPPAVGADGDADDHALIEHARERSAADAVTDQESMRARAAYAACVDFLDEVLGDLLGTLDADGFLDDTLVVYVSDHGGMVGEHGLWEKRVFYDAASRVPLLVQLPEHRSGDRDPASVRAPVSTVDVFPTVCSLVGVNVPDGVEGHDLSAAVRSGGEPDRGPVFVDNLEAFEGRPVQYRAVIDGRYKYVGFRDAPELLFDLAVDPGEQRNLAPDASGDDADALRRGRRLVAESMDFAAASTERERDRERRGRFALDAPAGTANAFRFRDGRVVDADTPIYEPRVLVEDPASAYDDYPGDPDP